MTGLMETVESQPQAFHEFPQPLGNLAHDARFPHSLGSDERAEKWKTKIRKWSRIASRETALS